MQTLGPESLAQMLGRRRKKRNQWALGIIDKPLAQILQEQWPPTVRWIHPPPDRYYADPFLVRREESYYLFFEELCLYEGRGWISVIRSRDMVEFSEPEPVLERDYHLSYPFILEHQGRTFCLPEQASTGRVVLYEALQFPNQWDQGTTLLEGLDRPTDPTIFRQGETWWMFLWVARKAVLYHARELHGPWTSHPRNPLETETEISRPAGPLFQYRGELYRPAQNGRDSYGASLILHKVLKLDPENYEEHPVCELVPSSKWIYPEGLHTLSSLDSYTVIDAKRRLSWRLLRPRRSQSLPPPPLRP